MKLIILMVYTISIVSSCQQEYEKVLNGLANNHVLLYDEMGKEDYLTYFKLTEEEYEIKSKEYFKAVDDFYGSDKDIINYLLTYENDTKTISNWISTPNPLSSELKNDDVLSNSQAAIILIYNFLLNSNSEKISKESLSSVNYQEIKKFYKDHYRDDLHKLRKIFREKQ